MDIRGVSCSSAERFSCTWIVRDIGSPNSGQDTSSIGCSVIERSISMNRTHAKELQRWMVDCKKDRKGVLSGNISYRSIV